MTRKPRKIGIQLLIALSLIASLITASCNYNISAIADQHKTVLPKESTTSATQSGNSDGQSDSDSTPMDSTGVELLDLDPAVLDDLVNLGVGWVRYNGVIWSDIENVEGEYDWDSLDSLKTFSDGAASRSISMVVVIRSTPAWAQAVSGYTCSTVKEDKIPAFAAFAKTLAQRYPNIQYWEIGNEPDVDPSLVAADSPFGCVGDQSDPYYGGGRYADTLKAVYPAIKQGNQDAKVVLGGLLLDCDPEKPGEDGFCATGKELPPKFLEGFLMNGGGDYVDFINFHAYTTHTGAQTNPVETEATFANWSARGGVVEGKVGYIRELLDKYGVDLPIIQSESGYICPGSDPDCIDNDDTFELSQAEYASWLLVRNRALNIEATIWYTYTAPGWRSSSILSEGQIPRPIYTAVSLTTALLSSATAIQPLTDIQDGLVGYAITNPDRTFVMIAPKNSSSIIVDLPENTQKVFDVLGNTIPISNQTIQIDGPVFVIPNP